MYDAGTKKEHCKLFPCLIKKKLSNSVYECQFMRSYKSYTETFIFPNVDDIEEVKKENIIRVLRVESECRGRFTFNK